MWRAHCSASLLADSIASVSIECFCWLCKCRIFLEYCRWLTPEMWRCVVFCCLIPWGEMDGLSFWFCYLYVTFFSKFSSVSALRIRQNWALLLPLSDSPEIHQAHVPQECELRNSAFCTHPTTASCSAVWLVAWELLSCWGNVRVCAYGQAFKTEMLLSPGALWNALLLCLPLTVYPSLEKRRWPCCSLRVSEEWKWRWRCWSLLPDRTRGSGTSLCEGRIS